MERAKGNASKSECPRAGFIQMECLGNRVTVPTNCKTWSCLACRDRVKTYVKMRMEHGILILGGGWLTTVTYRQGYGAQRNAASARKDWQELVRLLKIRNPNLAWFQIPELTKKKQIHFHSMIGGLTGNRIDCCQRSGKNCRHKRDKAWAMAHCGKDCLEHEIAKTWYKITGDSWVVDARAIRGSVGAASYLSKYLAKQMQDRRMLTSMGFHRRWSCSRNWPSPQRLRFAVTAANGWERVSFHPATSVLRDHLLSHAKWSEGSGYATKVGEHLAYLYEAKRVKGTYKRLERKLHANYAENPTSRINNGRD